nr:nuclear receptor coactivator 5 isoform X2 [Misgurnus anguillicaudatus]
MASWLKKTGGRRPPPPAHSGGGGPIPLRSYRISPYPIKEDRTEDLLESESFESQEEGSEYPGTQEYKHSPHQSAAADSPEDYDPSDQRTAIYNKFHQQLYGEGAKQPADCIVLSVNNQNVDYPKSIGQCLQERGLSVEMLYLQAESGLTRALQDVRSDGSPLCILVEQTNITLSSCTVIIFSESLKIHRNMPKEQALEFVMTEFGRMNAARREPDPTEATARVSKLTEDFMERAKLERHAVPPAIRHLLFLLAEGLHLYSEELTTLTDYLQNRQDHLQESSSEVQSDRSPVVNSLPPGLGKPPPLLPVGSGPSPRERTNPPSGSGNTPKGHVGSQGSYPKTKPPPLLSRPTASHDPIPLRPNRLSPQPSRGPPYGPDKPLLQTPTRGPLLSHSSRGFHSTRGHPVSHSVRGPSLIRGPPPQNGPRGSALLRGPRPPPPSLRSLHVGAPTGSRPPRHLLP